MRLVQTARPRPRLSSGIILVLLGVLVAAAAVASLGLGRIEIPFPRVIAILLDSLVPALDPVTSVERSVVVTVRLPRILLALLSGAGLALAGAALQGVFRNPLVGPQVVGVSSGAAFGGTLSILLGLGKAGLLGASFTFGMLALVFVYALNSVVARRNILALVLAGVVVSGFFGALVSLVQYMADTEDKLPAMVFWLLGSFATATMDRVLLIALPMSAAGGLLLALRWRIDLLSMGDEDARTLGLAVEPLRWLVLTLVAVIVAMQVAVGGMIGWVGLVVPHIARMIVGPNHRVLLPASLLIGGLYLLVVDDVARTVTSSEVPLGILTALIGTPVFAVLLRRSQGLGGRHG